MKRRKRRPMLPSIVLSADVKSLANGNMLVTLKYQEKPGVFTRLSLANRLQKIISWSVSGQDVPTVREE